MRIIVSFFAVLIGLLSYKPLFSSVSETYTTTEEVVVTASKLPQPQESITQKIDLIDRERIELTPFIQRNIAEIFRYQPGTFVNPLSRNDANWGSYGGLGPKYNVFLLEGLPIDSFADLMSLDPLILERAEVHRGPASIMYPTYLSMDFAGNQSPLAGITNLVLKEKISKPETIIGVGYGSWNTFNTGAYHQGRGGDIHYFFGGSYERSDYTDYGTKDSWLHILNNPDYYKAKFFAKATYFIDGSDAHKVSLFAHHTEHHGDVGRPNRNYDHSYTTVNLSYSNLITDSFDVQVKTGYRGYDRNWDEDNYPSLSLRSRDGVRQDIVPVDVTAHFKHGNGLFTIGSDAQWATYETTSESRGIESKGNDMEAWAMGVYAEETYKIDKLILRLGARYSRVEHSYDLLGGAKPEVDDASWDKLLWSTGIRYNLSEDLSLFANAGSSFVAPSGKSVGGTLSLSDRGVSGKHGQLPNPDLKPEKGIGIDGGVELRPLKGLSLGLRGFLTMVDDAIVENVISRDPSQSQSVNAGESRSVGLEIEGRYAISSSVEIFANYTFIDTKVENDLDPAQDNSDIPFVPSHTGNIGIIARLPWEITFVPYVHVFGKYYDSTDKTYRKSFGPDELINIHIEKGLVNLESWKAKLSLDLNNITNNSYEMPWQFRDPGFNVMAKVDIIF
ncbi:MAG: TonB-dependent receptor [Syntrophobacterales bacterium]|nr:TonB-dependent receptor [Syntrophobacterales bacterium]